MKKLLYLLAIPFAIILDSTKTQAQDYRTAAGLKFGGYEIGPSIKWFADEHTALEGIVGFRTGGFAISGLYEVHTPAFGVDKLNFFYGGGAHLGSLKPGSYNGGRDIYTNNRILIGADGVVGLEYLFPNSPIVMSIDVDPRIEFATGSVFDIAPALGIKYSF